MLAAPPDYKQIKLSRLWAQEGLLNHTRYFFREQHHRKFVVNTHHEQICTLLDQVIAGEVTKVMINIAPRYGKTELAVKNFISHGLSLNPGSKYIHLSYSDDLSLDNSEGVKSIVEHESYQALFPEVKIKPDSKAKKKWYTTAGGGVYATSAAGQVTGFGAGRVDDEDLADELTTLRRVGINDTFGGALIIDDPIKPEDADSEARRDRINARYDSTIKNRVNSRNTPIIIIMQRVHENDLCGYLLQNEPGEWEVLSIPCIQENADGGQYALWPFKHTLEELLKLKAQSPLVFGRQYMQNPVPPGGYLYANLRTYQTIPYAQKRTRRAYIDTADLGTDYLCSITYEQIETGMYVTDVLYTQAGMETTEPQTATQLLEQDTEIAKIESNNGGRGFARNVEAQLRLAGNTRTRIEWFHQSANKHARIFTNAASVQNVVFFPHDWKERFPKFYQHVTSYLAKGGNAHDDGPDALTGMVEEFVRPRRQFRGADNS